MPASSFVQRWIVTLVVVPTAIAFALVIRSWGASVPVQVLTLALGVVIAAGLNGLAPGITAAVVTVGAFNFWFTEPLYSFFVDDPQNYLVFAFLLATGAIVGRLADERVRRAREEQSTLLLRGLSHNLRTPLAVIGGNAAELHEHLKAKLDAPDSARLATIERETQRMTRQVENLLGLSRLAVLGSQLPLSVVPAEELLYSCRDKFSVWRPQRRIRVHTTDDLPLVRVEPVLLEQALLNLLENADRLAPPDTELGLRVTVRDGRIVLGVLDRGPGVSEDDMTKIFLPFVSRGGSGLGLALVGETARMHQGTCGVRLRHGGGSEFWIELPRVSL